ncbi:hypothetical protein DOTSEDRAFT_75927 [Dothistroma septosporum NZE10]|uniref:Uncharacterized protein n=1 Tax=Dothistroma septosporum (strain NZE10 / CBS 128990) TaxID=675120 RepID=N1PBR8_DOTSN|nr:hypothetical protein DOTSEDRAFT_75927 [Dothistroma septosporum NZE10]
MTLPPHPVSAVRPVHFLADLLVYVSGACGRDTNYCCTCKSLVAPTVGFSGQRQLKNRFRGRGWTTAHAGVCVAPTVEQRPGQRRLEGGLLVAGWVVTILLPCTIWNPGRGVRLRGTQASKD